MQQRGKRVRPAAPFAAARFAAALAAVGMCGAAEAGVTPYRFTTVVRSEDPAFVQNAAVNDRGDVAYAIDPDPGDLDHQPDYFQVPAGGTPTRVATHTASAAPSINNAGNVAFTSVGTGGSPDVVRRTIGASEAAVRIAGAAETGFPNFSGSGASINNFNTVAFTGRNASADDGRAGVFAGASPSSLRTVAESGARFSTFGFEGNASPRIDDAGDVLFTAQGPVVIAPGGGRTVTSGLYLGRAGGGAPVVIEEHVNDLFAPSGTAVGMTAMSENGWVAYVMGDATGNKTLYTWHDGERQAIVGTDGGPFVDLFGLSVNNRGQVFFAGQLPPPDPSDPNGQSGKWGIYFGDDAENEKLIAEGDTLFGDTVTSLGLSPYALNNHGQLVFTAQFVNHSEVILAEPLNPAVVPLPAALPAGALGLVAVAGALRARRKRI